MFKKVWGKAPSGEDIRMYTISKGGLSATVMNYGAIVLDLAVPFPDAAEPVDVALGYSNLTNYYVNDPCFGSPIGRNANRIGGASFVLDGRKYELEKNDGENNLHSGSNRYNNRIWNVVSDTDDSITFAIDSPHGDQGFPGNFRMTVTYTITENKELVIDYSGRSDRKTVWNPTFHGYFNLAGQGNGDIKKHDLTVFADRVTFAGPDSIPDGTYRDVAGTPMDFRAPRVIGDDVDSDYDLIAFAKGYDHNWALNRTDDLHESSLDTKGLTIYKDAILHEPRFDRSVTVFSDQPGIQVYTGNYITNTFGKGGFSYGRRSGIALETQYFPNNLNVDGFEKAIIPADTDVFHRTVYRFN